MNPPPAQFECCVPGSGIDPDCQQELLVHVGKTPPFLSVFASGESPMMLADRPAAVPAGSGWLAGSRNIFFLCSSQSSSSDEDFNLAQRKSRKWMRPGNEHYHGQERRESKTPNAGVRKANSGTQKRTPQYRNFRIYVLGMNDSSMMTGNHLFP